MTNTNDSKEEDRIGSIIVLYLAMPILLVISILVVAGYILEERLGVFIEFGIGLYALLYIPVATVSLPIGAILASLIKGKQAENDIDRKSISRKKIYIIYFFTIVYSMIAVSWLIVTACIFSAILTRMLIIKIKDEYKDRGLKAFIIAHLLYVVCAGAGAIWLHL